MASESEQVTTLYAIAVLPTQAQRVTNSSTQGALQPQGPSFTTTYATLHDHGIPGISGAPAELGVAAELVPALLGPTTQSSHIAATPTLIDGSPVGTTRISISIDRKLTK